MESQTYFEEIRDKSKTARLPVLSKKKMFSFENMNKQNKAVYMQETNLKNVNIKTMRPDEFRALSKDTQKQIMGDLIKKYDSNTQIAEHTAISRFTWAAFRKELGFEASKAGGFRMKHPTKTELQKTTQQPNNKNNQEMPKKEITNVVEIKICLENCGGVEAQKKLESLTLFLEDNKKYDINFVIKEKI